MKVIFDQNVPRRLAAHLVGHAVTRSAQLGWEELKNGDLLKAAEDRGFDCLITADRNMSYQQNLEKHKISVIVLPSGNWPILLTRLAEVLEDVKTTAALRDRQELPSE